MRGGWLGCATQVHTEEGHLLTWPAGGANVVRGPAVEGGESLTAVATLRRAFRAHDDGAPEERLDEGFTQLKELHKAMYALQVGALLIRGPATLTGC